MLQGEAQSVQEAPGKGPAIEVHLPPRRPLRPLEGFHGSLAQRVYGSLREAILSMSYRPGDILRKSEICEQLGVSRSPVSEAVARLAVEHLVRIVPQAGTYVARFSLEEKVAQSVTEDQLIQLRRNLRLQQALIEDMDIAGFYQTDAAMHELILSFTGFRRVAALADTSWVHVNRARQLILPATGRIEATLSEHQAIIAAIEARDPVAARDATRLHLGKLIGFLEPLALSRPDLFEPD
jgi:DNA-binding GntR family transcriptional regulator